MVGELARKVAIVTGGASGLGRATVERFVAEGARVIVADIDRDRGEALAERLGNAARFAQADVSQPDRVAALVDLAVTTFGGLHVMVNNAGVSGPMFERFIDDDLKAFDTVMRVNVLGVMAGTQAAARHMSEHGGGSIINTTSIGGIRAGRRVMTYRASKAAVIHFSMSAAIDLGELGVRVNCIAPGNIETPLLSDSVGDLDEAAREEFVTAVRRAQLASQPLQRRGAPEDAADAALFLASDRSRFVTGEVLRVDGGSAAGNIGTPAAVNDSAEGGAQ